MSLSASPYINPLRSEAIAIVQYLISHMAKGSRFPLEPCYAISILEGLTSYSAEESYFLLGVMPN